METNEMTEQEYIKLVELLEKLIDNCDMSRMDTCKYAIKLLEEINEN
jgi:hypothetical protein